MKIPYIHLALSKLYTFLKITPGEKKKKKKNLLIKILKEKFQIVISRNRMKLNLIIINEMIYKSCQF